jgi:hypothetical protein
VPIAAAGEVIIEGLQAREVPVAQDPTSTEKTDDEENAPDDPDTAGPRDIPDVPDVPARTVPASTIRPV